MLTKPPNKTEALACSPEVNNAVIDTTNPVNNCARNKRAAPSIPCLLFTKYLLFWRIIKESIGIIKYYNVAHYVTCHNRPGQSDPSTSRGLTAGSMDLALCLDLWIPRSSRGKSGGGVALAIVTSYRITLLIFPERVLCLFFPMLIFGLSVDSNLNTTHRYDHSYPLPGRAAIDSVG